LRLRWIVGGWSASRRGWLPALVLARSPAAPACGWSARCSPLTIPGGSGHRRLLRDPWPVHRLIRGLPGPSFGLAGGGGTLAGEAGSARSKPFASWGPGVGPPVAALLVNHPDFYLDLRTHARPVWVLRRWPALLRNAGPLHRNTASGARTPTARPTRFPYSPALHPIALLRLRNDSLLVLAGGRAVPRSPSSWWAMARRLGSRPGAGPMVLVPTYTSRLSFALLPSSATRSTFLLWLVARANDSGIDAWCWRERLGCRLPTGRRVRRGQPVCWGVLALLTTTAVDGGQA
jgi:hypothetical protein